MAVPLTAIVFFEVRNDKDRGNLILTIRREEAPDIIAFFKYHHQAINQHPEQVQQIVGQSKPTTRTKTIKVDVLGFIRQYWDGAYFEFKGVKLITTENQSARVYSRLVNKEVGKIKQKQTIAESKEKKLEEKNKKIRQGLASAEAKFQQERAKRIAEVMKK